MDSNAFLVEDIKKHKDLSYLRGKVTNKYVEALSLGVYVITMPIWTNQITNAKFIVDVWKLGVKAIGDDEKGIVRRETIVDCIGEVMESEKENELKKNSIKWKNLVKNYVDEGGSSDKNIVKFVNEITIQVGIIKLYLKVVC
ncbi:UDP glycosyltransferase 9-like [Cicer arietinum]|uniref:UDP glycosyltransferase 9-like n=1 Tax=Cicer arietinum TaxID=3827 RepID=UPI003CC69415